MSLSDRWHLVKLAAMEQFASIVVTFADEGLTSGLRIGGVVQQSCQGAYAPRSGGREGGAWEDGVG